MSQQISSFKAKEGSAIVVLSRVVDWQGVKVAKAAVSSITYSVYDLDTSLSQPTLKETGSITVATAWSDTYLTAGWTLDSTGYNAYCSIPASAFTFPTSRVRGSRVQIEIIATPVSGDDFCVADITVDIQDLLSIGTA